MFRKFFKKQNGYLLGIFIIGVLLGAFSTWYYMSPKSLMIDDAISIKKVDDFLIVEMPYGTIKFDPPEWKVEFNPTLEEFKQLDEIVKHLDEPDISTEERAILLVEKEKLIERCQRPSKHIGGSIIEKDGLEPPSLNLYKLYHQADYKLHIEPLSDYTN